jgi:hypothetical protein
MALVDTLEEQALLEQVLDDSKPAVPIDCRSLHYLLSTPFRYGALYPHGSRFRRAGATAGVFYASQQVTTAVAEMSFRRLLFYAESPGTPWPEQAAEYTAFSTRYAVKQGLDLSAPPLVRDQKAWTHPTNYAPCQDLADAARSAGVTAIRYESARATGGNVALLACAAFTTREPIDRQVWRIHTGAMGVRAICAFPSQRLAFERDAFARDPRIAALDWDRQR